MSPDSPDNLDNPVIYIGEKWNAMYGEGLNNPDNPNNPFEKNWGNDAQVQELLKGPPFSDPSHTYTDIRCLFLILFINDCFYVFICM